MPMTKEQKAIEILTKKVDSWKWKRPRNPIILKRLIDEIDTENNAIETVLSMLKEKDREIEHQIEKRNNQKAELAILNEKQKEMNRLINTVSSYKGMLKKEQKDNKEKDKEIERLEKQSKNLDKQAQQYFEQTIYLDKQIDLMAEYIARLDIDQDICIKVEDSCFDYAGQNGKTCEECIKQYFKKLAKEKGE